MNYDEQVKFTQKVCQRELPVDQFLRVKILAKELAEGALENAWIARFVAYENENEYSGRTGLWFDDDMQIYTRERWKNDYPDLTIPVAMGYLIRTSAHVTLTHLAFALINDVVSSSIFISYKRSESSALALLVAEKLKHVGLHPFIDMSLIPGEDWEAGLKDRIEKSDYMVLLLSNETLKSEVTLKEIGWAMDANVKVIPIWHNGFSYKSGAWGKIPVRIDELLTKTHTIRVLEENPLAYNTAMTELLNRFGIMP
jgi:hypothetical protein